jgi:hypothetical protein
MEGALIRPTTDRVRDSDLPPFFTEEALLRLEDRLRAQRVQQVGRRFLVQDAHSQRAGLPAGESEPQELAGTRFDDPTLGLVDRQLARFKAKTRELTRHTRGRSLEQIVKELSVYLIGWRSYFGFCQTPSVLHSLDNWLRRRLRAIACKQWKRSLTSSRPKIRTGEPFPSPFGRRQKLCALLLIVAVAVLGVSLKARTGGSTDAASVNIEARGPVPSDNAEPRRPTMNAGKSSAAMATPSPSPANDEPHQSTTNTRKSSAATATPSPSPANDEPHQSTTNTRKSSAARATATLSLPPVPRDRPMNNPSKRKGPLHTATRSLPRDNDEIGQLIAKTVKSSAAGRP